MKTHITAIALALASFGAAAQTATGYDNMFKSRTGPTAVVSASALSRDAVRADLLAAIDRGERFPVDSRTGPTTVGSESMLSRESVLAEVLNAIDRGERFPVVSSRTGPTMS